MLLPAESRTTGTAGLTGTYTATGYQAQPMLISPLYLEVVPAAKRPPRISPRRIVGIALSLILHLGLLIHLTLPPLHHPAVEISTAEGQAMSLVLLATPMATTVPVQAVNMEPVAPPARPTRPTRTLAVFIDPAPVQESEGADGVAEPAADAQRLFNGIEAAAAEIVASDPRLPNAGMPSALGRVPGRAEPFVHLPLVHREGSGLSRALAALGQHMIVGELDDNPLRSSAERSARRGAEPVCNDPESPLADERCWLPPEE